MGEPLDPTQLSARDLLARIAADTRDLVRTEVALARAELAEDLRAEKAAATGLGIGALLAYAGVIFLFVALVFGLSGEMPDWGAALVVAGGLFVGGGLAALYGWRKRVARPLERTRRQVGETLEWAKGRMT
jgi:uncharacterized membrane protein YqjE